MGTTPAGWPYPEPTDPIASGAAAIRSVAEAGDGTIGRTRYATGTGSIAITTAGTATSTSVTFPGGRFTAAPRVFVTPTGTTPLTLQGPMVANVTTAGCEVWGARNSGTAGISFQWFAIQIQ